MPTPARYTGGALLDRLDAIVDLAGRRRGLALLPTGALAGAEVRTVAAATGLPIASADAASAGEVALLAAVGVAVGLLRVRGQRLEVTSLRGPWAGISPGLRAGIVYAAWCHRMYAAWCHRMPWASVLGADPAIEALHERRLPVLRVLHGLPAAVEVDVAALAASLDPLRGERGAAGGPGEGRVGGEGVEKLGGETLTAQLAAALLAPLGALGVADLDPPPPATPSLLRLSPAARTVVAAALLAAGEDVPG